MRTCYIVLWAFGFGAGASILWGFADGILIRTGTMQLQQVAPVGTPFHVTVWACTIVGAFLGIYEKLPGTKRPKSGLK